MSNFFKSFTLLQKFNLAKFLQSVFVGNVIRNDIGPDITNTCNKATLKMPDVILKTFAQCYSKVKVTSYEICTPINMNSWTIPRWILSDILKSGIQLLPMHLGGGKSI